ncbi:MAG: HTTM domain-containing protein, partial [Gemmataceae bacterium]
PAIHESIDLLEALRLARTNVQQSNFGSPSARAALEKQIEGALKLVPRLHDKESKQNAEIQLADHVHKLLNSEWAAVVRPPLLRMHPFALNGARYPQGRFFVIEDAGLTGSGRSQELSKFAHGAAYPVWLDLARLRPQDWRVLPGSLFCFIDGKPRIVWNYFLELNMRQIQKMATHPSMLQRYAEHVARQWQQETGRTPEVRVLSLVHFNYRKPQMQIDPRVDLAHTTYQLFGHNDWIMPLSGETPELPDSLYAVEQND